MNDMQRIEEFQRWRRLKHEVANDFAVVSMGLHCLSGIREDPLQFAEIVEMMAKNLDSLKTHIDHIIDLNKPQDSLQDDSLNLEEQE